MRKCVSTMIPAHIPAFQRGSSISSALLLNGDSLRPAIYPFQRHSQFLTIHALNTAISMEPKPKEILSCTIAYKYSVWKVMVSHILSHKYLRVSRAPNGFFSLSILLKKPLGTRPKLRSVRGAQLCLFHWGKCPSPAKGKAVHSAPTRYKNDPRCSSSLVNGGSMFRFIVILNPKTSCSPRMAT